MNIILVVTKYQLHYYIKNMSFTQSQNVIQLGADIRYLCPGIDKIIPHEDWRFTDTALMIDT